jgi:molecular chaperone HtpG
MDRCEELLPPYMRFVKGVVDSSDLPLNISRELLQHNPLLEKIAKNVLKNALDALASMKNNEYDKYVTFFKDLGGLLKEGVGRDWTNREKLADLLLFESMKTPAGQYTTLSQYVGSMPEGQKEIYYLIGESRELVEHSPLLEAYRAKGYDVLFLTEPIDEFAIPSLPKYKDKPLAAIDRSESTPEGDEPSAEVKEQFATLLAYLKGKLPEVGDVRLSKRLTDSAACLVAGAGAMTAHMERLMQKLGRLEGEDGGKRVLELNPNHPAVAALRDLYAKTPQDERVELYGRLLYDQAVIAEGSKVRDPLAFAKRINELLARDAKA